MSSDVLATAFPGTTPAVALLGNLPNAILLIDDYGVITYANVAAELLFARGTEALIGKPFSSLLADSHREAYEQMVDAFSDGERVEMLGERREVIARQPDGTGVAIELSLSQVQQGRVRVLAAPMIPGLNDHELASIIKASANAGLDAALNSERR